MSALSASLLRYLALAACAACFGDIIVHRGLRVGTLAIWLQVFLALVCLSCIWSINPAASRTEMMSIGGYLVTALAIAMTPRTIAAKRRLATAVVLGGVAASVVVVVGSLVQGGLARETLVGAASASDPNDLAASLLLPLALAASGRDARWPLRLLGCGILVAGVLATGSRGGAIGVLIVLGVALNWGRKGKAALGGVLKMLVVLAIIWVLVVTLFPALLTRLSYAEVQGGSGRLDIWRVGLKAFGRFGSIGAGIGSFPMAYNAAGAGSEGYSPVAHNIFLQIGVELGVPGLMLFCLSVASALKRARTSRAGIAVILGVLAASFFLGTLELSFFWVALTFPFLDSDPVTIRADECVDSKRPLGRGQVKVFQSGSMDQMGLPDRPGSSRVVQCMRRTP